MNSARSIAAAESHGMMQWLTQIALTFVIEELNEKKRYSEVNVQSVCNSLFTSVHVYCSTIFFILLQHYFDS